MKRARWFFLLSVAVGSGLLAAPPVNDDFAGATGFPERHVYRPERHLDLSGLLRVELGEATAEPDEPANDAGPARHSVWFTWTAPMDGDCHFEATAPTGRPHAAVHTGDSLSALRLESAAVPGTGDTKTIVRFRARKGADYRLTLDVTAAGQRVLADCRLFYAAANDNFADRSRIALTNASAEVQFRTMAATREPGEPVVNQAASVWFGFVAPETGAYEFAGRAAEMTVAVFRGEALERLDMVALSGTNLPVKVRFTASEGEQLSLAVSTSHRFGYSDQIGAIYREPRYDPAPAPPVSIGLIQVGPPLSPTPTNRLALRFQVRPLREYQVETSDDLVRWRPWRKVLTKGSAAVVDFGNGEPPGSFQRVVVPD